jgi:hypothetical protein
MCPTRLPNARRLFIPECAPKKKSDTDKQKALASRKVMVNLVNLIDHMRLGTPLIKFKNFKAFREYTLKDHMYPKKRTKEQEFIRILLRHVF